MERHLIVNELEFVRNRFQAVQNVSFAVTFPGLVGISSTSVFPVQALFSALSGEGRAQQGEVLIDGFAPQPGSGNVVILEPELAQVQEVTHYTVHDWLTLKMQLAYSHAKKSDLIDDVWHDELTRLDIKVDELMDLQPEELTVFERRMLVIATIGSNPVKVILVTRFLTSLTRDERRIVFDAIQHLGSSHLVLVHDTDLSLLMECARILVFHQTALTADDSPEMIGVNPIVRQAFTGMDADPT